MKVVEAIRALPECPSVITVDTLHRFLSGDENSAQDAKTMIDACAALMREFNCSIILVHHTGVSDEAQHRARGSSAWKGALEIEISVVPSKGDGPIQIVQRKSKDAEEAKPVYAVLELVQINGWVDEDGDPVSSAVITQTEAPPEPESKGSKESNHMRTIRNAWDAKGKELMDGFPYITRSGLLDFLCSDGALSKSTAEKYVKPGSGDHLIGCLLNANIIAGRPNGWVVIAENYTSVMLPTRNIERT